LDFLQTPAKSDTLTNLPYLGNSFNLLISGLQCPVLVLICNDSIVLLFKKVDSTITEYSITIPIAHQQEISGSGSPF